MENDDELREVVWKSDGQVELDSAESDVCLLARDDVADVWVVRDEWKHHVPIEHGLLEEEDDDVGVPLVVDDDDAVLLVVDDDDAVPLVVDDDDAGVLLVVDDDADVLLVVDDDDALYQDEKSDKRENKNEHKGFPLRFQCICFSLTITLLKGSCFRLRGM